MKFSAQEEYGLRCLLSIATAGQGSSLTIPEIGKREGLTPSHVAKLLSVLRKAGYVKSARGKSGGYCLNMVPGTTLVSDVLEALGGRLFGDGYCDRYKGVLADCAHEGECLMRPLWERLQTAVDTAMEGVTIGDLIESRLKTPPVVFHDKPERHTTVSHR